jgi:hypothetical protein
VHVEGVGETLNKRETPWMTAGVIQVRIKKKKRGARQKEVGIVMQQMANGASQIIIAHRVTT